VCLVGEPIEQGLAEPGVGEDLRPLGEGQVGGYDDGGLFGSLCDHLEEQLGGDFGQRDIAEFIDDDQLHAGLAGQHAPQTLLPLRFDELVDQRSGCGKAHSSALTTGGDRQAGGEMTLAGAGVADQQDRLGAFEIAAFGQGADAGSRDMRRLSEVELFERLDPWQVRFLQVYRREGLNEKANAEFSRSASLNGTHSTPDYVK
jgi:hypothetical protein